MKKQTDKKGTVTMSNNYARVAILLLAANFMLTGYAIASLIKIQEVSIAAPEEAADVEQVSTSMPPLPEGDSNAQ